MIGYHYTTLEAYQEIKIQGLKPSLLSVGNQVLGVAEYVKDWLCVWVYIQEFTGLELIGQLFFVSCRHNSPNVVCLEVEYEDSAKRLYEADNKDDWLELNHDLTGIKQYSHYGAAYDLIVKSVPPQNIRLIDSWNLLELI